MVNISSDLRTRYMTFLHQNGISLNEQSYFQKWLRYYLDFCHKYHFSQAERVSLRPFLRKLQEKKQKHSPTETSDSGDQFVFRAYFRWE